MAFDAPERTLERLEWPAVLERLGERLAMSRSRERFLSAPAALFESTRAGVDARLAETSEARARIDAGESLPLADIGPLDALLVRVRKDGLLTGGELWQLARAAQTGRDVARYLQSRVESSPVLAALGDDLEDLGWLHDAIAGCLETDGSVKDSASPELARARREANETASRVQSRIQRYLGDASFQDLLQDRFTTVRNDRFVLPIRAEAKSRVPGIVHDASSSGTTLYIEPQAVVELNNKLRQAELTVERETRRVLSDLCSDAASCADALAANLARLEEIDLAFARGALGHAMDATTPEIDEGGRFALTQLHHPLIDRRESVPNDLSLGGEVTVLVISGPNAGGKTVTMKALGLGALFVRAGLQVPADPGSRVPVLDRVLADIGDEQDLQEQLSTFSAHMSNLAEVVRIADERSLVLLDEVGVGTDPGEGAALAQAILEALAETGARVVTTTHYNLLKEMADVDERFANASVEFDGDSGVPTYRLKMGTPGASSATSVASRMGMPGRVVERATALLEREDRQLERMLTELSASRAALRREQEEASRARREGEAARARYRGKLERLQERRDKLFDEMRRDLDAAFRDAHGQVAAVIRDLQRGGRAQDAAHARTRLLSLEARAKAEQETQERKTPAPERTPVDWTRAQPGDRVSIPSGQEGQLESLPDRRGRVRVRVGNARLTVAADQLTPVATPLARAQATPAVAPEPVGELQRRVDLRGLRVEEALDELQRTLDHAANDGAHTVEIVHGVGTGALREAVRKHLHHERVVERVEAGGSDGATVAHLR